jgi:hypothetical protein
MRQYLKDDGCIIISQTVQPNNIMSVRGNWWYLAPRNGHVSTYTEESLEILGASASLNFYRGSHLYGFATEAPSSYALAALQCVRPSFTTVRLLAPPQLQSRDIASLTEAVLWFKRETDGVWLFRWTGSPEIEWQAEWGAASRLQVRVPFCREACPGFAARCELSLGAVRKPVILSGNEMVAEFDVDGRTSGRITLYTPEVVLPEESEEVSRIGGVGLAILLQIEPLWPAAEA